MKKLLVVLTALCLVFSMTALAEDAGFVFRNGVTFGMTQDEVIATEGNTPYEVDNEDTHGPVTFVEVEYENITQNGVKGDLAYLFRDDKLVAVRLDFEDKAITFDEIKKTIGEYYGESMPVDLKVLGNGIFAVDDDGHAEVKSEAWLKGNVAVVLEEDEDGDIDVTYVDLSASYIK